MIAFLEGLDINTEEADPMKTGWKQLKKMIEGKDRQMLQTLIDNETTTKEHQKTPWQVLDTIGTTIKSEDHFGYFWDKFLSGVHQQPDEGINSLSIRITALINQLKFPHDKTKETLKIMVLQHTVRYLEAHNWIQLQDQSQLTYRALCTHCWLLMFHSKQYQEAKEKGQADLTSLSTATSLASSIHQDALTILPKCNKCGYSHAPPSAQLMARRTIPAAAIIITLPSAREAEDPTTPSVTADPGCSDYQADHSWEKAGPSPYTATPTAGTDSATPHACTPTDPKAKGLPQDIQAGHLEETGDQPPTGTIRVASK